MIVSTPQAGPQKTSESQRFQMVSGQNDRMAGSVPVRSFAENLAEATGETDGKTDASSDFGFSDIIDMINPLQHIPVVSNLYQSATGDTIGAIAQIVGGAIFGGPIGALTAAGFVAYQSAHEGGSDNTLDNAPALYPEGVKTSRANARDGYDPYNS